MFYFAGKPITEMLTHTCPNCNNEYVGNFCNNCGQKQAHRITMHSIWHDLIHAFTHTDKGFFYMIGQLFMHPGKVAYEYIVEAKRKKYFPPFQYLIIIGAVTTFIVATSHYMENAILAMNEATGTQGAYSAKQIDLINKVTAFQNKYFNIMLLLQLPFFALASYWLYKKKKYNYAELLTLQTFVNGQTTIITLVTMVLMTITQLNLLKMSIISLAISAAYQVITFTGFFNEKNISGVLKAIASYLIGLLLSFIFIGLIFILIIKLFYQ